MATLPPVKRFTLDDYSGIKDISAFAAKLFYPLNLFLTATYSALNNGLTLNANTIGMVTSNSSITSNSAGIATTTVNWGFPQSPPQGVAVINCTISSVGALSPLVSWSYSAGVVTITMQFVVMSSGAVVAAGAQTYSCSFWITGG